MAGEAQRAQRGGVASPPARALPPVRPRAEAFGRIFGWAEKTGEGFRFGALGLPRFGKTRLAQQVIAEALRRGVARYALVHDVKKAEPQYEGAVRNSVQHFEARPPAPGESRVVVFHPGLGPKPSAESVAQLGFRLARGGCPVVVHVDELLHAVKEGSQSWNSPTVGELVREGSSNRASSCYTTQFPQRVPTESLDMVETVAIFNLQGRPARYAAQHFDVPIAVVQRLPEWHFVLVSIYDGWAGVTYGPK